jgi:hypothetical protein
MNKALFVTAFPVGMTRHLFVLFIPVDPLFGEEEEEDLFNSSPKVQFTNHYLSVIRMPSVPL